MCFHYSNIPLFPFSSLLHSFDYTKWFIVSIVPEYVVRYIEFKSTNPSRSKPRPMVKFAAKTILLVDDNQRFLTVLADELRECGNNFNILTAESGGKALKILESVPVDLVVTDLKMPVMGGFELISHMKKKYPGIPVIVLSSFLCPELEPRLRATGVSQWIEKVSLSIGALKEMIATLALSPPGRGRGGGARRRGTHHCHGV